MKMYVGLDVHCKQSVYAIQNASGREIGDGKVPTTIEGFLEFRDRHHLPPGTKVALETGSSAFHAARLLARIGMDPIVVDAHEVRLKAHRPNQKSDRRDAIELCEGLRRDIYRIVVHVPSPAIQQLRQALSRRRHFVQLMNREINAAKHLLRSEGLVEFVTLLRTESAWNRLVGRLVIAPDIQGLVDCHRALWVAARDQVLRIEAECKRLQEPFQESVTRLQAIPGVGPVVSQTVVATLSDVTRFPTAKHVASYAGLVPSTYQTGERNHQGHITKRGSGELRAMLCEAAQQAARPRNPLQPFFARVCAKRGYRMAIIAVAHRLLRIMYAMLRNGDDFDVARLGIEAGPFEVKTTRHYRLKAKPALPAPRVAAI
jgi:transposase